MSSELTTTPANQTTAMSAFSGEHAFETAQRMANALQKSDIVPQSYKGNLANCLVALEIAQRTGSSVLAVMQNMFVIQGRPSWGSSYIIAAINSCGRFSPLRFDMKEVGEKTVDYTYWEGEKGSRQKKTGKVTITDKVCIAWCMDKSGERLDGPPISIEVAVKEGWYTKADSKWQTMPELMLRYRAAAFFGRLYAPDVLMGMQTAEEVIDVEPIDVTPRAQAKEKPAAISDINKKVKEKKQIAEPERPEVVESEVQDAVVVATKIETVEAEATKTTGDFF